MSTQEDDLLIDADDVVAIAHEESYQEAACTLLETCAFDTFPNRMITLRALAEDLEWEVCDVYIPLLFLALDGKVGLLQDEFFGDLYVQLSVSEQDTEDLIQSGVA